MSIIRTFNFIWKHPLASRNRALAFNRFFKWQLTQQIQPLPVIYPFIENSKLLITKGMVGATGNIYTGLHEFNDMAFLLHFLRGEEVFIDVGANVGAYTVLASGVAKAYTLAVEPVPSTFKNLYNNVLVNSITDYVELLNIGLGSKPSQLEFTARLDSTNHVVNTSDTEIETIIVEVNTLDNVTKGKHPVLIKIDVEGFEQEVLNGAQQTLSDPSLLAIIIEINDSCEKYGFSAEYTRQVLIEHNFAAYTYSPFDRKLIPIEQSLTVDNTIYIRDIQKVNKRLQEAAQFTVLGIPV